MTEDDTSNFGNPLPKKHRIPLQTPKYLIEMERAAVEHAEANRSDPFARGRIWLHMKRGLLLPSDVMSLVGIRRIPS